MEYVPGYFHVFFLVNKYTACLNFLQSHQCYEYVRRNITVTVQTMWKIGEKCFNPLEVQILDRDNDFTSIQNLTLHLRYYTACSFQPRFLRIVATIFKTDRPSFKAFTWALITSSADILCDHWLGEYCLSSSCQPEKLLSTGRP